MNRDGHKDVKLFIGCEVEHTPAFSKKTLFVVGKQDVKRIEDVAREHKAPHIFLGANHSFEADHDSYWCATITALLDKGFMVTLDYPAHTHEKVLTMFTPGVWQCRNFVPLLSVRIPKIQTSSPNLTVKIDDVDFKATNPGVWCLHFHEVTDSNRFTDWQEYGDDYIIDDTDEVVVPIDVKPVKTVAEPVAVETFTESLNSDGAGLDAEGPSQLKPEPVEEPVIIDTVSAAEAYAEGAIEDPLGKVVAKKTKVTKKA